MIYISRERYERLSDEEIINFGIEFIIIEEER